MRVVFCVLAMDVGFRVQGMGHGTGSAIQNSLCGIDLKRIIALAKLIGEEIGDHVGMVLIVSHYHTKWKDKVVAALWLFAVQNSWSRTLCEEGEPLTSAPGAGYFRD